MWLMFALKIRELKCSGLNCRVADPGGVDPDTDPTLKTNRIRLKIFYQLINVTLLSERKDRFREIFLVLIFRPDPDPMITPISVTLNPLCESALQSNLDLYGMYLNLELYW